MLDRQLIHAWANVTNTRYYLDWQPVLLDFMRESRRLREDDWALLELQVKLLKAIYDAENAARSYKRDKARWGRALQRLAQRGASQQRLGKAQARLESVDYSATGAKWIARYLRSIGDSIAWRLMNYNRAKIQVLVEHEVPGAIQPGRGLKAEVQAACEILEEKQGAVILNAVTNFFRIADICVVNRSSGEVKLIEVKAGSRRMDTRLRRQVAAERAAVIAINRGVFRIGGRTVQEVVAPGKLMTYQKSVGNALAEAKREGASSRVFGNYLGITCANILAVEATQHLDRAMSIRRSKADILLPYNNFLPTVHFVKNMAPYPIFPFPEELCLSLMTGQMVIMSVLNLSGLASYLSKRGWQASIADAKKFVLDEKGSPSPWQEFMTLQKGGCTIELAGAIFAAAALEFWMPDTFANYAQALYERGPVPGDAPNISVVFEEEHKAWD